MLTSYLTMQNAILAQNVASSRMVHNSNRMLAVTSFGNSLPLKPSFSQISDSFEIQNKADETKISVLSHLIDAMESSLSKKIKRNTPKYGGIDYKA